MEVARSGFEPESPVPKTEMMDQLHQRALSRSADAGRIWAFHPSRSLKPLPLTTALALMSHSSKSASDSAE